MRLSLGMTAIVFELFPFTILSVIASDGVECLYGLCLLNW